MGRQPASDAYDALPVILNFIPGQCDAGRGHNVPIINNKMISHRRFWSIYREGCVGRWRRKEETSVKRHSVAPNLLTSKSAFLLNVRYE